MVEQLRLCPKDGVSRGSTRECACNTARSMHAYATRCHILQEIAVVSGSKLCVKVPRTFLVPFFLSLAVLTWTALSYLTRLCRGGSMMLNVPEFLDYALWCALAGRDGQTVFGREPYAFELARAQHTHKWPQQMQQYSLLQQAEHRHSVYTQCAAAARSSSGPRPGRVGTGRHPASSSFGTRPSVSKRTEIDTFRLRQCVVVCHQAHSKFAAYERQSDWDRFCLQRLRKNPARKFVSTAGLY